MAIQLGHRPLNNLQHQPIPATPSIWREKIVTLIQTIAADRKLLAGVGVSALTTVTGVAGSLMFDLDNSRYAAAATVLASVLPPFLSVLKLPHSTIFSTSFSAGALGVMVAGLRSTTSNPWAHTLIQGGFLGFVTAMNYRALYSALAFAMDIDMNIDQLRQLRHPSPTTSTTRPKKNC